MQVWYTNACLPPGGIWVFLELKLLLMQSGTKFNSVIVEHIILRTDSLRCQISAGNFLWFGISCILVLLVLLNPVWASQLMIFMMVCSQ